jgi:putative membrane protein
MSPPQGNAREPDAGALVEHVAAPIDYRFTLANERTFLSWIRTALGLLAGGVAVHTVVVEHWQTDFRAALAISCLVLSLVVAVGAYLHWRRIRAAMDAGRPLPGTVLVPILSAGTAFVAVLACVAVLLH